MEVGGGPDNRRREVLLIGQKETKLLLDNNFDEGKEPVFHLRLQVGLRRNTRMKIQDNVLLLCYSYTMARPGS